MFRMILNKEFSNDYEKFGRIMWYVFIRKASLDETIQLLLNFTQTVLGSCSVIKPTITLCKNSIDETISNDDKIRKLKIAVLAELAYYADHLDSVGFMLSINKYDNDDIIPEKITFSTEETMITGYIAKHAASDAVKYVMNRV